MLIERKDGRMMFFFFFFKEERKWEEEKKQDRTPRSERERSKEERLVSRSLNEREETLKCGIGLNKRRPQHGLN